MPDDLPLSQTTRMTFAAAMERVRAGASVRLPSWNDESRLRLHEGRIVLFLGGQPSNCEIRTSETLRNDRQVIP